MYNKTIAVIGAGVMSTAILRGAVAGGKFAKTQIRFADKLPEAIDRLRDQGYPTAMSNTDAVRDAAIVILAVRPKDIAEPLTEIAPHMHGKALVSICAGISIKSIESYLPKDTTVYRAMPNLPMTLGAGMTALCVPPGDDAEITKVIQAIMESSGRVMRVTEDMLDQVTAVSGSGPGYCFAFALAMQQQAEAFGFTKEQSRELVAQTLLGSALMLLEPDADAAKLAGHVAVPGGTTEAALRVLESGNLNKLVADAMEACRRRAAELG